MSPTLNVIAEGLTDRLVTVPVDEVGEVGDELEPPQELPNSTIAAKKKRRSEVLIADTETPKLMEEGPMLAAASSGVNLGCDV